MIRRIGYVYIFYPYENRGILMYGKWKVVTDNGFHKKTHFKNRPIVFDATACLGDVRTGQLVYFSLDKDGNAVNVERASLANFDVDLLEDLIKVDTQSEFENNVIIEFEDIKETANGFNNVLDGGIDELIKRFGIVRERVIRRTSWTKRIVQFWKDSIYLNTLNLSLWIDDKIVSEQSYFGRTPEEIQFLYDLFVERIRIDSKGYKHYPKKVNNAISPMWTLLLSKLSNDNLVKVIKLAPKLQPALPVAFCKNNLDILDDQYGMPTKDLCKDYCFHKINNASTATEYRKWAEKLHLFSNCNVENLPGEGVSMCTMDNGYIKDLERILEKKYNDCIEVNIIFNLNNFLGKDTSISVKELSKAELLNIGVFLDGLNTFKTFSSNYCTGIWSYRFEKIVKSYTSLEDNLKGILLDAWINFANASLLDLASKEDIYPLSLGLTIKLLDDYIVDETKSEITSVVNDKFLRISNFSDLKDALEYGFISEIQFLDILKRLSATFTITQFARLITVSCSENGYIHFYELPIECQRFVLNRMVEIYGTKELCKGESVSIAEFNGFGNLESFIRWLTELKSGQYGNINHDAIESAISKAIAPLSEDDIKKLIDKGYLVKASDGIETALSKYYDQVARDIKYQNYRDSLYDEYYYGKYSGSWAQEVEGYDDDDIDTIFDGDPDAYWNID